MKVRRDFPLIDEILASFASELGDALPAYRNHVCRVMNYFSALSGDDAATSDRVFAAAAFHDLGIWTERTFDYIEPSIRAASAWLATRGHACCAPEVATVIGQHHKLRGYHGPHAESVEPFRRADLVDLSLGAVRFGLDATFIRAVKATFPNRGFHRLLLAHAASQAIKTPLRPLPMVRW